jgi:hypothetical protein
MMWSLSEDCSKPLQFRASVMSDNESNKMWWHGLTSYHWFVFIAASLAWLFDCLDQQIFMNLNLYSDQSSVSLVATWEAHRIQVVTSRLLQVKKVVGKRS